jgi:hypothetical protein
MWTALSNNKHQAVQSADISAADASQSADGYLFLLTPRTHISLQCYQTIVCARASKIMWVAALRHNFTSVCSLAHLYSTAHCHAVHLHALTSHATTMPHRIIYYRWMCDHCPQLYDEEVDCIVHERTCAAANVHARLSPDDNGDKLRTVVTLLQTDPNLLNVVNELINSRQEQLPLFNDIDKQKTMLAKVDAHSESDAAAVDDKQACSSAIVVENISPTKRSAQEGKPRRRLRPQRQCRYCPRMLDSPSKLRAHERIHTGERPEECDICHKRFALKCNLTLHRRRHTGERPYQCRHCTHCFMSSDERAIHERVGGVRACAHVCCAD